jgi:WD40 repeat protein
MRPSNHIVFSGGLDENIKMWDINKRKPIANFSGDHASIYCIQTTFDQEMLVGVGPDA